MEGTSATLDNIIARFANMSQRLDALKERLDVHQDKVEKSSASDMEELERESDALEVQLRNQKARPEQMLEGDWCWVSTTSPGIWLCSKGFLRASAGWNGFVARYGKREDGYIVISMEEKKKMKFKLDAEGNLYRLNGQLFRYSVRSSRAKELQLDRVEESLGEKRQGGEVAKLLVSGCISLVRGDYFEHCLLKMQPTECRQRIPARFCWDGAEAVDLWQEHGSKFLLILSYGWITGPHPDPDLFHLRRLTWVIRKLQRRLRHWGGHDVAVAVDWCSLWQREGDGNNLTEEQKSDFNRGLKAFNELYIHQHTTALKLMRTPEHVLRSYHDRGWPLCESKLIDSKGGMLNQLHFHADFDEFADVEEEGIDFMIRFGRSIVQPPLTPEQFEVAITKLRASLEPRGLPLFTNGHDSPICLLIYQRCFEYIQDSKVLDYTNAGWGDTELRSLSQVMRLTQTKDLILKKNKITEGDGLAELCDALCASGKLQTFRLHNNQIGEAGADTLARLASSLPSLVRLELPGNPLCQSELAKEAISKAWQHAGKDIVNLMWEDVAQ